MPSCRRAGCGPTRRPTGWPLAKRTRVGIRASAIQVAQAAGLTIAEIQTLINELDDDTPLSERWQTLAHQKLAEVDALMRKVQGMKMILANGLNCRCTNLEECIDCIIRAEACS